MRFKVLGPLQVTLDDGPIPLGGPKQRAVLAHLIVRANDLVPADALIDQVWGDEPPEAARGTLHSYISHLRKALGAERIESRPPGYVLHVSSDELDAARFETLLGEARLANGSPGRAGNVLREALGLWDGPPFADLASEPALGAEIARLDELRVQALEDRIAADLAEGRHGEVIGELESLTRELPLRERLWELLMLALYRSRRPADALGAYERAKDALAQELGVDPSPDLRKPARADPPRRPGARPRGRAAPGLPAARPDRRGRVRRRLSGRAAADRSRGGDQGRASRAREPPGLRPSVRARGADRRPPRAPSHRPALRLLARTGRRVPRHAVPPGRERRRTPGRRARSNPLAPRRCWSRSRRRSRRRIVRGSSTGT